MKIKILLVVVLGAVCLEGYPQNSLDTLLKLVVDNNQQLKAASHLYDAEVIAAKVGNSPPNPEVEYGYMWGTPDVIGERTDFTVTQSFDFPTAYTSQSKLTRISNRQSELKMMATKQEVLMGAHKTWIEGVFLNIQKSLLEDRLGQAQQVFEGFQQKYETGEANILQLNQARLKTSLLNNELERTKVAILNIGSRLNQLTGGNMTGITETQLPGAGELILDTLLQDYNLAPVSLWYENQVSKREQEADVLFNRKLPKLMAGYYSEYILNTKLRGIKAGISIPLWGNARAVNSAKAGQAFASSDAWRFQVEQQTEIVSKYQEWANLKQQVTELETVLEASDNESLLLQSVDAGEISLTQYYYESDFFFQSRLALLKTQRDMLLLEADLIKIYR